MKKKQSKQANDYFKLLPIGLILLIVPLIVYLKVGKLDEEIAKYWNGSTQFVDFFSYYKVTWFIALTCFAVIFTLSYIACKKVTIAFPKLFIPLAVYLLFAFLSSSFSEFKGVAFMGFPDRYEGFFVILFYVLVCFICSTLITSNFDIKYLYTCLAVSAFIAGIIGFTQFFGFDILQSPFGKNLMLPAANENLATGLKFNFPEKFIYSTLYNPNYVGSFFAMILPACLVLFILSKTVGQKVITGILCSLSFLNLVGSLSATGYISAVIACLLILVYLRADLKRNWLSLTAITLCFCIIAVIMNITSGGMIFRNFKIPNSVSFSEIKDLSTIATAKTVASNGSASSMPASPTELTDISLEDNVLSLYISDTEALVIKHDAITSNLTFADITNNTLDIVSNTKDEKQIITFNDPRFSSFSLIVNDNGFTVQTTKTTFNVVLTDEGMKMLTPANRITDIIKADSFGFQGRERWGSSRGYIWSRSIPLLKDTVLLGNGPDTYAIYFPQNDYVAKLKYLSNIYTIVDKPHNAYLQMAINTGVLSLIAFLVFVGWYCLSSLKLYLKGVYNEFFAPGVACLAAVISYLVSGLSNDSTISVSPVFWILLGVGIACNRLYGGKV